MLEQRNEKSSSSIKSQVLDRESFQRALEVGKRYKEKYVNEKRVNKVLAKRNEILKTKLKSLVELSNSVLWTQETNSPRSEESKNALKELKNKIKELTEELKDNFKSNSDVKDNDENSNNSSRAEVVVGPTGADFL